MLNKFFALIIFLFVIVLALLYFLFGNQSHFSDEKVSLDDDIEVKEEPKEIKIYFVGDIMLDRGVLHYIKKNDNWLWPFLDIADDLKKADLVFGNLESMISDKGYDVGGLYSFRAPPETMQGLVYADFDILSVANNHSFDYTINAFTDTLKRLKENNILYAGGGFNREETHSPTIKQVDDTKVGFLAYTNVGSPAWQATEDRAGIAWIDDSSLDTLKKDIEKSKEKADILVVSFHFGYEYHDKPNENQKLLSNTALKSGADIVVGHHPHVVQPLEITDDGVIAYSLGNFIFDQYFSEETMRGAILEVIIKDKEVTSARLKETRLNEEYQVKVIE